MQILLHSDPDTDGGQQMSDHVAMVVDHALARFGERVTRVEAYLCDAEGHTRSSGSDIHCTLEARLIRLDAIVVKDHAGNAHQAIEGAARKLERAVSAAIAKHDPRARHGRADLPVAEASTETAT